jgi:RimJ/RimL family protein N-acetyltransferase
MRFEAVETTRLRIRQFDQGDLDHCLRLRREVFGLDEPAATARAWLRWTTDSYRELAQLGQPPYADYAVELRESGAFIGSAGIVPAVVPWGALKGGASDSLLSPEIGLFWGILPAHRRRGYATEAARALLAYLFHALRARQVVATTERDNHASQRTMEKLGMRLWRNPNDQPHWCQVVGQVANPGA